MSKHSCEVVEVKLLPHPNADSLSIVKIKDFQVVVKTADWVDKKLGIYIEPDSLCPDTETFAFLENKRIKAKKLRGEWSLGLLIPAPENAQIGEDYMEKLGIIHYEPPDSLTMGGDNISAPKGIHPDYDVENFRKYSDLFVDGEEVVCTEKIHGSSSRFVCVKDQLYCGSHHSWKAESDNMWWKIIKLYPVLEPWLRHHQDLTVYGEIYGWVQNLRYGARQGQIFFAVFDIMKDGKWLDYETARKIGQPLPWVPVIYRGPYKKELVLSLAEGKSTIADHCREGIVIKPVVERKDHEIGRVQLKIVGNTYLGRE